MNDYTGIVSSLRECCGEGICDCSTCAFEPLSKDGDYTECVDALMLKAADAIEKLSTEVECLKSYMGEYKAAYILEHDARTAEYKTDKDKQYAEARAEIIRRFGAFRE